jgi:hypothetical protein
MSMMSQYNVRIGQAIIDIQQNHISVEEAARKHYVQESAIRSNLNPISQSTVQAIQNIVKPPTPPSPEPTYQGTGGGQSGEPYKSASQIYKVKVYTQTGGTLEYDPTTHIAKEYDSQGKVLSNYKVETQLQATALQNRFRDEQIRTYSEQRAKEIGADLQRREDEYRAKLNQPMLQKPQNESIPILIPSRTKSPEETIDYTPDVSDSLRKYQTF